VPSNQENEEPDSQPQQEESGSESESEQEDGQGADILSEADSTDSDESNEAEVGMDLEFELGEELGASVWGLEGTQDDRMSVVDSDEGTSTESDVDSLVGEL
jgi:hypothetical protein